ncbi:MAG: hypothetical protein MRECE_29c001, partial [Mycoplasmataceae bacterium CE_OT135]
MFNADPKINSIQPRGWNDLINNHRYFLERMREKDQLSQQCNDPTHQNLQTEKQ